MGWMAPFRHRRAKLVFCRITRNREPSMSEVTTIGLDLAKHVFQVHGIDAQGATVLRKRLRPGKCWRSSAEFHAVWLGWKRVQRRTTGRASSPRLGTRCG